ncbi:MAG: FAD-dependent oxidoreductase [Holdemania massiliensis]
MKMNRKRSALCLSAFLLCSLITGCAVNQGNNAVPPPSPQTTDADVIVVGAGPAGMSAALSAVENGAEKVILLERRNTTGGTMTNTSGSMSGADTIIQQLDGYTEDSRNCITKILRILH